MPPSPGVWNRNPQVGPIVKSRVLGFAFSTEDQEQWAEDHQIEPQYSTSQRRMLARKAMYQRLPPKFRHMSLVYRDPVTMASCIVIASNRTAEDLKKAEDLETINVVRRALDFPGPPQWYRPERPFG